jgi:hypothetical protein
MAGWSTGISVHECSSAVPKKQPLMDTHTR